MTKFLFCNVPYQGHINPTLPVVQELVKRGAKVVYYCSDKFGDIIQASGATFRPYRISMLATDSNKQFSDDPVIDICHNILQQILDDARSEKANYLIYDSMCLWGMILSMILQIPAIRTYVTFPINKCFHPLNPYSPVFPLSTRNLANDQEMIKNLCSAYNLPSLIYPEFLFQAEPLNIVFHPREFHPAEATFDEKFLFVGPSIFPRYGPSDISYNKLSSYPVLYVSLGSVFNNVLFFYDICLAAFGNQSRQVVISTGNSINIADFGPLPHNVIMCPHVPQLDILQQAEVFITHGGLNSIMEALYYEVPLVVVPQTREQRIFARRIEELELGIAIENKTAITAYILRKAVEQVISSKTIRTNIQNMRNMILKSGGYTRATDAIMQLTISLKFCANGGSITR